MKSQTRLAWIVAVSLLAGSVPVVQAFLLAKPAGQMAHHATTSSGLVATR